MSEQLKGEIYSRIPHDGAMRLIDRVDSWDGGMIRCSARSHTDPNHPLRHGNRLAGVHALEYAAQAIAIHAGLLLPDRLAAAVYVAAFREVEILGLTFDGTPSTLLIEAARQSSGPGGWSYRFSVTSGDLPIAAGRALLVRPEAGGAADAYSELKHDVPTVARASRDRDVAGLSG